MKSLIIAMLLSVVQTAPPVPRQASDKTAATSQEVKTNPDRNQAPPPVPLVQNPATTPKDQNPGNPPAKADAQETVVVRELPTVTVDSKPDQWNHAYVILTGALVLIGALGVCFALRTLKAIEKQVLEMAQQRAVMRRQTRHIARQAQSMRYQTTHLKNAVIQARRAAKAAKLSADMAVGVSVPTLVIEGFDIADVGAANIAAMIQYPKIKMTIRNYGQTPAVLKWWTIIFACESLPDVPIYERDGIVLDKIVVKPNSPYVLPQLSTWQRQEISLDDVQAVLNRTKTLTAYGYICYGDVFGSPLRRLKFCQTALNIFEHGAIQWVSGMCPPAYEGIDKLPLISPARKSETKAEDRPEKPN